MASYVITYDLTKPNRNYSGLYTAIKGISGTWAHVAESSWIVVGNNLTTVGIRDELMKAIDNNDKLVVCKLTGEGAWIGLSKEQSTWLKSNL